ncbi:hypothetical protein JS44_05475 [Anoxybacillus flavithermus]|uniref:Uncharacterized protein n=1 Tax=Anoxybacillus flavithermus TaxID=33934 RepID=A0A094IZF0_9BACL|nr:hypothetical protein JS44_05475 [Anoxybacillus flavithermus]
MSLKRLTRTCNGLERGAHLLVNPPDKCWSSVRESNESYKQHHDGWGIYICSIKKLLTAIDVNVDWIETEETMIVRLSRGQMSITAGKNN